MKIRTVIELEIVTGSRMLCSMPVAGIMGPDGIKELKDFLDKWVMSGDWPLLIRAYSEAYKDDREYEEIFPEAKTGLEIERRRLTKKFKDRLEARLDETREDIGEWILPEDRLPPQTVLGLCSPVCRVKNRITGVETEGVYHGFEGRWKDAAGGPVGYQTSEIYWAKKEGVFYAEPQARYDAVAREMAAGREEL